MKQEDCSEWNRLLNPTSSFLCSVFIIGMYHRIWYSFGCILSPFYFHLWSLLTSRDRRAFKGKEKEKGRTRKRVNQRKRMNELTTKYGNKRTHGRAYVRTDCWLLSKSPLAVSSCRLLQQTKYSQAVDHQFVGCVAASVPLLPLLCFRPLRSGLQSVSTFRESF